MTSFIYLSVGFGAEQRQIASVAGCQGRGGCGGIGSGWTVLRLADVHFARRRLITGRTRTVTRSQTGGVTPRRARLVQPSTRTRPAPVTVTATTILTKSLTLTFIRFVALSSGQSTDKYTTHSTDGVGCQDSENGWFIVGMNLLEQ